MYYLAPTSVLLGPTARVRCLLFVAFVAGLIQAPLISRSSPTPATSQWGQWRGPLANGTAPNANPPTEWSETNHVVWKRALPGKGHSSPVVWDDRIYVSSAEPFGEPVDLVYDNAPGTHDNVGVSQKHRFLLIALDRKTGAILWQRTIKEEFPHEGGHVTGSLASSSPVTDGQRIYASFGSQGVVSYDREGTLKWRRDFGRMQTLHAHGEGSSVVLQGKRLVLNWDHEGDSFLAALDTETGKELWKTPRDEKTSWSTPITVETSAGRQVVVSATKRIRGYDLETGRLIWECGGLSRNVVSSPIAANGMVFAANSYDWQALIAIRVEGAKGDITDTDHVAWRLNRLTPYVPSLLFESDTLYFLRHNQNILSGLDPKTGKPRFEPFRLANLRDIFSSPVSASGRIYVTSREGITVVVQTGETPKIIAVNRLDDIFSASAALVGNQLFLRGEQFLYCLGETGIPAKSTPETSAGTVTSP